MLIFQSLNCPAHLSIMEWIKGQMDWNRHVKAMEQQFDPLLQIPGFMFDAEMMHIELLQLMQKIPSVPWRSQAPGALHGISLSYNPQVPQWEWHCGSFGHPRYQRFSAERYFTVPEFDRVHARRGDYLDSLSFRSLIPEIQVLPHLAALFRQFCVPVVRCTLRIIDGERACASQDDGGGMHCDDPPFEMLRLNLCITGSENFGLQYAEHEPMVLKEGEHRIINSDIPHRVWVKRRSDFHRMHLIIGLVPWLNYDAQADAWTLNEHFGKTHPYDLVRQGQIVRAP